MISIAWVGQIEYEAAWTWQKERAAARSRDEVDDRLQLLTHPPTYTLGRSGHESNLLYDAEQRAREGIALHWVDRGGDVTYHGPGQLVGYPIFQLKSLQRAQGLARPDLHLYLRHIEEILILALAEFGIEGWRYEGYTGVWVTTPAGSRKIAAIGIKVSSKGVTSHGFALNVDPNMDHFAGIVPCGIEEHGVVSMAQVLNRPVALDELFEPIQRAVTSVFPVPNSFIDEVAQPS